tara:strand:- start:71 stop:382 length:312 start_codon:yes stop_codon:yes gene_type:complete
MKEGTLVIGIVYKDGIEIARAEIWRTKGSAWAGRRLMNILTQKETEIDDTKTSLRYLGTCLDHTYGSCTKWDHGQKGRHINYKMDSQRYPVKVFIPFNQEQFK